MRTLLPAVIAAAVALACPLGAQWSVSPWAQAIVMETRVSPAFDGRTFTEGYLTQPVLGAQARAPGGWLSAVATIDLEGLTLRRGQLDPGIYGEGYVDRRHPHTYLHELVASAEAPVGSARLSLSGGKGFAPFGTEDPMMRPFAQYPVNHHLAQILERALVSAAAAWGPATVEAGVFNGDEPTSPGDLPNARRFADSWSARAMLRPLAWAELQGSVARVASPELDRGGGAAQHKASVSLRAERAGSYALAEWAHTQELVRGERTFAVASVLGEAARVVGPLRVAARVERTVRPEEERELDVFRSARPASDASILGRTRFTVATAAVEWRARFARAVGVAPFVEVARSEAHEVDRPAVFVPRAFYGAGAQWQLSAGVRLGAGTMRHAMGRYGAAAARDATMHDMGGMHDMPHE